MTMLRRRALLALAPLLLAACSPLPPSATSTAQTAATAATAATAPEPASTFRTVLAPRGELRVGVYLGSPTSLVRDASGKDHGVAVELGQALASRLGVPHRQVEFARLALVLDALKAGEIDFTVTNATPVRALDMNFSMPLIALELGLLVPPGSALTSVDEMDRPGRRIGVAQGSSSQTALGRRRWSTNRESHDPASLPVT